ncbi:VOC family protein [Amycolatopsis sp., V23-08]|uniref:VOC family protein n=1 Tax=Amycolatopsis heterodermiae TaxID=3110235 RepID=A0ABU5RE63_9PSEU|nr:VOC family protein [Amycolatopsis sp., V23-08]MEA5364443.1 VOC family protein [Amycolatopsis sp., V23-08]
MRVMPIRYSSDVEAVTRFYRVLGLRAGPVSRPGSWVELPADGGVLAVHRGDAGRCELAFETDEALEDVAARLREAGFEPGAPADEGFGYSLRVRDPDGVWVQINQYDRELYT